jgi:Cap4 SAVED domain
LNESSLDSPKFTDEQNVFLFFEKKASGDDLHKVVVLSTQSELITVAECLAAQIPDHYVARETLEKWGRRKTAALFELLPEGTRARSSDLGEIFATEYIDREMSNYEVPIKKLRWKDHREQAMRGNDILAFDFDCEPLSCLKAEAKSRKRLHSSVVAEARNALQSHKGLPAPHSLAFIVNRLFEEDRDEQGRKIAEYVEKKVLGRNQVAHLLFTFSENDPEKLLEDDAQLAEEPVKHFAVGLYVADHPGLIELIYEKFRDGRNA